MTNFGAFWFFALCLLYFTNIGSAIKCWECRSDADAKCADPFDNTTLAITDCSQVKGIPYIFDEHDIRTQRSTLCRKIRQKVNGVWKYFRSCAFLGEVGIKGDERFCLMRTGTYNIFMEYCTCNSKDGCNTAARFIGHKMALYLVLFWTGVLFWPLR